MRPTKRTQPYRRRPARPPSDVLKSMQAGKPAQSNSPSYAPGRKGRKKRRKRRVRYQA